MDKIKINIRILGSLKYKLDHDFIKKWTTNYFEIQEIDVLKKLDNSTTVDSLGFYYYSDNQLKDIIGDTSKYQIVVGIINQKLEDDYYERVVNENSVVLSLYETAEIVLKNDYKLEYFIIQEIYYYIALYYRENGSIDIDPFGYTHQDLKNCLFDFNNDKTDIAFSIGKITLCDSCKEDFNGKIVPIDFVDNIRKELKRIKKDKFIRLRDWIKKRPILSLIIGVIIAIIINVFSNYIYDLLKEENIKSYSIDNLKIKTDTVKTKNNAGVNNGNN